MRRTPWCCVWGVGLALLVGSALTTRASAQGVAKGAPPPGPGPGGALKPGKPKVQPAEKRISFSMVKKPWQGENGVLKWLSDQLGIPLVGKEFPTGSFNFVPPTVDGVIQTYTLPEVVDLINRELQREKWVLVRYKDHFTVLRSDAELPHFPRVDLDELAQRGSSEVVSLVYPLKRLSAGELAPEIQQMLMQPFGKVVPLEASNRLVLQDTVQSLRQIVETIRNIEGAPGVVRSTVLQHTCQYQLASEAAEYLKRLLGDEKEEVVSINQHGQKKVEYRVHKVAVDESTNTVMVTGPSDKIAKARAILQAFDRGREKVAVGQPFLKMYPVTGNAEAISKVLQEAYKASGNLKVAAVNSTTVAVWAGPEMQIRIAKELMPPAEDNALTSKSVFIPLTVSDPDRMASFLSYAFPGEKGKYDGPTIDADTSRGGLLVHATEKQLQDIKRAIASIEGQDNDPPGGAGMRIINLGKDVSAARVAEALGAILKKVRPDVDVELNFPIQDMMKQPDSKKKPEPPKQLPKTKRVGDRTSSAPGAGPGRVRAPHGGVAGLDHRAAAAPRSAHPLLTRKVAAARAGVLTTGRSPLLLPGPRGLRASLSCA
jgi:hypothetical protein